MSHVDIETVDTAPISDYQILDLSSLEPLDISKDLIGTRVTSTLVVQH